MTREKKKGINSSKSYSPRAFAHNNAVGGENQNIFFFGITFYFYSRLGLPEKQKIKNALSYYYSKLYRLKLTYIKL